MSDLRLTAILKTDLRGSTPLFRSFAEDHWDAFIEANHVPCSLDIGMHYGQLTIFRWFAYGEDILMAIRLASLVRDVSQDEAHSSVLLSGKISQMVLGTEWEKQLLSVAWDKIAGKLPQTDYAVCELLPVHSQTLPASGL